MSHQTRYYVEFNLKFFSNEFYLTEEIARGQRQYAAIPSDGKGSNPKKFDVSWFTQELQKYIISFFNQDNPEKLGLLWQPEMEETDEETGEPTYMPIYIYWDSAQKQYAALCQDDVIEYSKPLMVEIKHPDIRTYRKYNFSDFFFVKEDQYNKVCINIHKVVCNDNDNLNLIVNDNNCIHL